jgi:hypothetical protein
MLTSFGTLADAALAEDKPEYTGFSCRAPLFGTARCGHPDQNIRVGRGKRLSIHVDSIKDAEGKGTCVIFFVIHAVSGEQIGSSVRHCSSPNTKEAWTNHNAGPVDVYLTVKSEQNEHVWVNGEYIIERP